MFKGKTTAGYKSTTGKQLGGAKTKGKVAPNPRKPLPTGRVNVVTKAVGKGVNPKNSRSNMLAANRVQRAAGGTGKLKQQTNAAAKIVTPRGTNSLNKKPFSGYSKLSNSRTVPAGKGNIRNAGAVQRNDVARLRSVAQQAMPKAAISGSKGFKGFIGGK